MKTDCDAHAPENCCARTFLLLVRQEQRDLQLGGQVLQAAQADPVQLVAERCVCGGL
jgi:hypothetical protein